MRKKVLFTFLGRGKHALETGYRKAMYQFPDETVQETTFFGYSLAKYLQVDELVIFGTSGSQWSVFVENFVHEGDSEDLRLKLIEAESQFSVNQEILNQITPVIEAALGLKVSTRIIPQGKSELEQYEILKQIAQARPQYPADISIDVTHGYRHLAMIGFLSVFVLERLGSENIAVEGLWYGALDMMKENVAPVLKLDGLVRVHNWIDALGRFDSTGNYAVMANSLRDDGVDAESINLLEKAAFHEYTNNSRDAKKNLEQFIPKLTEPLDGASELFRETLNHRLNWIKRPNLASHQRELAEQFLRRGDYLRASIFGWEAYITKRCEEEGVEVAGESRKEIVEGLQDYIKGNYGKNSVVRIAFFHLRNLRNTLAHGGIPTDERVKSALRDQDKLKKSIRDWFDALFDEKC